MTLETSITQEMLESLNKIPRSWWRKITQHSRTPRRGLPDVVGCLNGTLFGIELKRSKELDARPLQVLELEQIQRAGGVALIIRGADQAVELARLLTDGKVERCRKKFGLRKRDLPPRVKLSSPPS